MGEVGLLLRFFPFAITVNQESAQETQMSVTSWQVGSRCHSGHQLKKKGKELGRIALG